MGKNKQWKQDGEEDKFIKKLIKEGKVTKFTKPITLSANYPNVFGEFTPNVIRNHLNIVKRNSGLYLDGDEDDIEDGILEHESSLSASPPNCNSSHSDIAPASTAFASDIIAHQNYPMVCQIFKDPDTECDKVLMVVNLPAGSENAKVVLNEDELVVFIKYNWSQTLLDVKDLFNKQLAEKKIHVYHPMVMCYKSGLELVRNKIDVAPESVIKVNLPTKVQTALNSWKNWGVKRDNGTLVILAEFSCHVTEYMKKSSDETVTFDH